MSKHKEDNLTITKLSLWKGISVVLAVLLLVSLYTGGFGTCTGAATAEEEKEPAPAAPQPSAPAADKQDVDMEVLLDDDTVKGDEDAPVTIVEWSEFECPFCTRFYNQAYAQIKKEYIDTGKVKIVFRDFPLGFHAHAQKAAEAAECAGEQGNYWEMHDKLFEEGLGSGVATFKEYARDLGLNSNKFDDCLDNGDMADEVAKDMRDGQAVGIRGTPGFIINGQLVTGAQPFSVFQQAIDAALAE